ncbi:MAG: hypothetical protein IPP36_03430 [Nitrosomonadales bacterium]|nr:hypothetical protein [Nitrosomonadales bacterium]
MPKVTMTWLLIPSQDGKAIFYSDWNWTASCEYSDIVWGVDSWLENKHTDMACSCSNPFLTVSPITPLRRFQDTVGDAEVPAGIFRAFTAMTGDQRFADYFKFVGTNPAGNPADRDSEVYGQRVLNAGSATRGMVFAEIREKAKRGIPSIFMARTCPRISGWSRQLKVAACLGTPRAVGWNSTWMTHA